MSSKPSLSLIILWLAGACEVLLLARFVARMLAARPDNPSIMLLYGLTNPLVAPLHALDYDQPPYGGVVEFSTLALALILPLLVGMFWLWHQYCNQPRHEDV
ncbi:YggT family protein [Candidatus Viridilinea mediisalina]|nr:YggT family protein [Candidatus Viridilinea mediisalina]